MRFDWTKILKSKLSKWYFYKYFGIPKDKEIFKLQKTSIHYWEDKSKGIAICKEYGQPLIRIKPIVGFLSEPERGSTDTSSTNNKDAHMHNETPTTNQGNLTGLNVYRSSGGALRRTCIHFTLSAGSGTISDVKLYLYSNTQSVTKTYYLNAHQLSRTDWVEGDGSAGSGVTWNSYDGTNPWTTAGGDFSATIIDSILSLAAGNWMNWVLMGTGSDNPLTLNWNDNVHILLKIANEGVKNGNQFNSKENASNKPYLEITYEVAVGTNIKVNIGDTLKSVDAVKINIGDSWKNVDSAQVNIGDNWKSIF